MKIKSYTKELYFESLIESKRNQNVNICFLNTNNCGYTKLTVFKNDEIETHYQ